jgi:hypothetical protein
MADRLDDGGMDDPDIRPGDTQGIQDENERTGIDDPEIRPGETQGIHDVNERSGIDDPNLRSAVTSGGGFKLSFANLAALGVVGVVVVVGAFMILKPGGSAGPSGSAGPGVTQPGATAAGGGPSSGTGVVAGQAKATLKITSGPAELIGEWALDGSVGTDITGATLLATTWAGTTAGTDYEDLASIAMGGTIASGTRATSGEDLSLGFNVNRNNASGEVFNYQLSSRDGTCQITMSPGGSGLTGSFTCTGVKGVNATSGQSVTVNAEGTFSL